MGELNYFHALDAASLVFLHYTMYVYTFLFIQVYAILILAWAAAVIHLRQHRVSVLMNVALIRQIIITHLMEQMTPAHPAILLVSLLSVHALYIYAQYSK